MIFPVIFTHQAEVAAELEDGRQITAALSFRLKSRHELTGTEINATAQWMFSRWAICRSDPKTTDAIYEELEREIGKLESANFEVLSVKAKRIIIAPLPPADPPVVPVHELMAAKLIEKERCAIAINDTACATRDIDLDGESLKGLVKGHAKQLIQKLFEDPDFLR